MILSGYSLFVLVGWLYCQIIQIKNQSINMNFTFITSQPHKREKGLRKKPVFDVCDQLRSKPAHLATQNTNLNIDILGVSSEVLTSQV